METSYTVVIVLAVLLAAMVLFSLLKGVIKLLLLAVAARAAIAAWIFVQRNGFTLIALIVGTAQPWMVQVCAWSVSILIFAIFFQGMNWFSQLFSWRRNGASTGGILTTALMCSLMVWIAVVGIAYYGDVSRISYYSDVAKAQVSGGKAPGLPLFTRLKNALREAPATAWMVMIDPMEDAAQANLACIVAYGCTLPEAQAQEYYRSCLENSGVPHPSRFLDLFCDKGLRTLVEEKRFVTLLENEHLKTFLQRGNTQEIMAAFRLPGA